MLKTKTKRSIVMHSQSQFRCRIPTAEVMTGMRDLSTGAFKLLIYYYSRSTGWGFTDTEIASILKVSEKRVVELRKELTDMEYFHIEKGSNIDNYFIGRTAVREWKYPEDRPEDVI